MFNDLGDYPAAIGDFDRALSINPNYPAAHSNASKSLAELKRYDEALAACDRALALKPDLAEAWFGRGFIFSNCGVPKKPPPHTGRRFELNPRLPLLKGNLLHQKMLICDWSGVDRLIAEIDGDLASGQLSAEPFGWQGVATSPRSLQRCAELYSASRYPAQFGAARRAPIGSSGKIRIGYLSGEFRQQATSLLLVGVLEHHDREPVRDLRDRQWLGRSQRDQAPDRRGGAPGDRHPRPQRSAGRRRPSATTRSTSWST